MLELNYIRENTDAVIAALRARGVELTLEPILELDRERREMLVEVEQLKKTRNERSREIGAIVKSGQDAEPAKGEVREIGERISKFEQRLTETESELDARLAELPNVPHESVPVGRDESHNAVVRTRGTLPEFSFEPRPHWELGELLGILDFERAAKISGARFAVLFGEGALLERALIQFMLDLHTNEHGYLEVLPPFLINQDSLIGTG
jgi:seryl-tRNA synthetase